VSIVKNDFVERFKSDLSKAYTEMTGLIPDFYQPEVGPGAGRIS
jgi:galactokinase